MGFCDSRLADATADTPTLGKRPEVDMRHQRKGKKQQPLTMTEATQVGSMETTNCPGAGWCFIGRPRKLVARSKQVSEIEFDVHIRLQEIEGRCPQKMALKVY